MRDRRRQRTRTRDVRFARSQSRDGRCIDLAERLIAAGEPVTITVYPDTYHGFDGPVSQGRLHLDVPNGVNPGGGVTVAPNPAARDDAYAKLKRFLRAQIGTR
jgi:dienelactone hydrolase